MLFVYNTTFRRLGSVSVFRWNLLESTMIVIMEKVIDRVVTAIGVLYCHLSFLLPVGDKFGRSRV
jgi:hypothetical protein